MNVQHPQLCGMLLEKPVSHQQYPEDRGRNSMTHWRKEIRKEADKNVREHERDAIMGSLPGESHGQRSLVGYSPWGLRRVIHGRVTEHAHMHFRDKIKYYSHTFDLIFILSSCFTGNTWILHFL